MIPFEITCYDKAFNRLGWIADPTQVQVTPRHLAIGTASIELPSSHPKAVSYRHPRFAGGD
jgi:hypothetical protein